MCQYQISTCIVLILTSGLKKSINRIFTWSNRFRMVHAGILILFFLLGFWIPLMKPDTIENRASSFSGINDSSIMYTWSQRLQAKRCSLLSTISVDKINNYMYMNILNICLCVAAVLFIFLVNISWKDVSSDYFENSYRCFRKILIYLAISSMCNQLVSAFTCRSIDIFF